MLKTPRIYRDYRRMVWKRQGFIKILAELVANPVDKAGLCLPLLVRVLIQPSGGPHHCMSDNMPPWPPLPFLTPLPFNPLAAFYPFSPFWDNLYKSLSLRQRRRDLRCNPIFCSGNKSQNASSANVARANMRMHIKRASLRNSHTLDINTVLITAVHNTCIRTTVSTM